MAIFFLLIQDSGRGGMDSEIRIGKSFRMSEKKLKKSVTEKGLVIDSRFHVLFGCSVKGFE